MVANELQVACQSFVLFRARPHVQNPLSSGRHEIKSRQAALVRDWAGCVKRVGSVYAVSIDLDEALASGAAVTQPQLSFVDPPRIEKVAETRATIIHRDNFQDVPELAFGERLETGKSLLFIHLVR